MDPEHAHAQQYIKNVEQRNECEHESQERVVLHTNSQIEFVPTESYTTLKHTCSVPRQEWSLGTS